MLIGAGRNRQELAMSRNAVVQCGDTAIDWIDIAAISHWLKVRVLDLDEKSRKWAVRIPARVDGEYTEHRSGAYSGEDLEYFRETIATRGEIDFRTMLIHARGCESTNPRDKVYSVLGMTGGTADKITIDYSRSISAVAVEAFRTLVAQTKSLDALIWSQNPHRQQSIPTWAPNICAPFSVQPSRLKGKTSSLYSAAGSVQRKEQYSFDDDGTTLCVQGAIMFDTIQEVSSLPSMTKRISRPLLDRIISEWRPLVFNWLGGMEVEQKYERFMSALTCDRGIGRQRLPKQPGFPDWGTFFRVVHHWVGAKTEFEYLSLAVGGTSSFVDTGNQLKEEMQLNAWLNLCIESIGGRRMVMTTEKRIGLVPAETQAHDVVCLLGLDVPFVLRKVDVDTYIVIGEAYIHGVMDGEIVNTRNGPQNYLVQDIKLW